MKKIMFSLLWLFVAATALMAQPLPSNDPDSLAQRRQADEVVRNAPFIFKAETINSKILRSDKDEVIVVRQLKVIDALKGNLVVGDTVELAYSMGWATWNEYGQHNYPIHSYHPDVYWGNINMPVYYFCKEVSIKPFIQGSKKDFQLYSENPFSVAAFDVDENINPEWEKVVYFSTHIQFHREAHFLNYVNKILTPQPIKILKVTRKAKNKHKRSVGTINNERYQLMPQKVFNDTLTTFLKYLAPNNNDSLATHKYADAVVQNSPFIFKGKEISEKTTRGNGNELIVIKQVAIMDVIKGSILANDTIEIQYSLGNVNWQANGSYRLPSHGYIPDVAWSGSGEAMYYYFCKQSNLPNYFKNSKLSLMLVSETPFTLCTVDAVHIDKNNEASHALLFCNRIWFKEEADFLNYLNKLLTPKPIKSVKEPKKGNSKKHKKTVGAIESERYQIMPQRVINVSATDSTGDLANYNYFHNGWYDMTINANCLTAGTY